MPTIKFSAFLLLLLAAACSRPGPEVRTGDVEGLPVELRVAPPSHEQADVMFATVREQLAHTLSTLSETQPDSEIARINRAARTARLPISRNTFRILDLGHYYHRATDGFFDYTMGPIAYLWGFKQAARPTQAPGEEMLYDLLEGTGMRHIQLFGDGAIAITSPFCRIELGALREAYAVDTTLVELRRRAYGNLFLRAGRAARQLDHIHATPWTHLVRNADGDIYGQIQLSSDLPALAWQSLYDEVLVIEDQRISGLINPKSGRPADQGAFALAAGSTATKAMILAQTSLIAGMERTTGFLSAFEGFELLFVPFDPEEPIYITAKLAEAFIPAADLTRPIAPWPTMSP